MLLVATGAVTVLISLSVSCFCCSCSSARTTEFNCENRQTLARQLTVGLAIAPFEFKKRANCSRRWYSVRLTRNCTNVFGVLGSGLDVSSFSRLVSNIPSSTLFFL